MAEPDDASLAPRDPHPLPSRATPLARFTAFYERATFNKDGSTTVILKVDADNKDQVVALSRQDGKALNVTIHETLLPPGMEELARAVGLDMSPKAKT